MRACALLAALLFVFGSPAGAESFASVSAKAKKAEARQDLVSAIEAYTSALRLWQKSDGKKNKAKILAARAALYSRTGAAEPALKDLSEALKLDKSVSSYYFRRGRILYDLGRNSDALSDFYQATKLNLNYKEAYLYRGFAYERQGDATFAREDYRTACKLGLKAACTEASRAKAAADAAAAGATSDEFAAATPEKPRKRRVVQVDKPRPRRRYKLDWQACLDGLNACTDAGGGFADCVKKAAVCETDAKAGCCPQTCVKRFNDLMGEVEVVEGADGQATEGGAHSEASAYREVFAPDSDCAK